MARVARSCDRAPFDMSRTIGLSLVMNLTTGGSWPIARQMAMWLLLIAGVVVLTRLLHRMRHNRLVFSRVLILGGGPLASKLIEELRSANGFNHVVVGIVDDEPHERESSRTDSVARPARPTGRDRRSRPRGSHRGCPARTARTSAPQAAPGVSCPGRRRGGGPGPVRASHRQDGDRSAHARSSHPLEGIPE